MGPDRSFSSPRVTSFDRIGDHLMLIEDLVCFPRQRQIELLDAVHVTAASTDQGPELTDISILEQSFVELGIERREFVELAYFDDGPLMSDQRSQFLNICLTSFSRQCAHDLYLCCPTQELTASGIGDVDARNQRCVLRVNFDKTILLQKQQCVANRR